MLDVHFKERVRWVNFRLIGFKISNWDVYTVRKTERSFKLIILSELLKKSNWSVSPQFCLFCLFVIGVNQLQKHVIILKTQILNGHLIRISNLRRDVRRTFQRASPVSEVRVKHDSSVMIRSQSTSTRVQESNSIRLNRANVNLISMQLSQIKQI
jgi:hypothetical protein